MRKKITLQELPRIELEYISNGYLFQGSLERKYAS